MAEVTQRHRELAWRAWTVTCNAKPITEKEKSYIRTGFDPYCDFPVTTSVAQALADIESEAFQKRDEEVANLKSAQMAMDQMRDTLATYGLRMVYG